MIDQLISIRDQIVSRVNAGAGDAFGIVSRENGEKCLIVQRRWMPLMELVVVLCRDDQPEIFCFNRDFPYDCALMKSYDEVHQDSMAEFSVFESGNSGQEIVTSDCRNLQGIIFAAASQSRILIENPYAVSAVFDPDSGSSSLYASGNPELIKHMETEAILYARSLLRRPKTENEPPFACDPVSTCERPALPV